MDKQSTDSFVNVAKIYETIQDKGFIQDLWLDVMSDIKEKPSYARMKDMVDKVIGGAVEKYATKPKDHEERLKTRTIFSELSIMTYTIDTLISEILHKKLKDEFKSIIGNILEELKKKQISLDVEEKNESLNMLENIGELLCNGSGKEHRKLADDPNSTAPVATLPNGRISESSNFSKKEIDCQMLQKNSTTKHRFDSSSSNIRSCVGSIEADSKTSTQSSKIKNKIAYNRSKESNKMKLIKIGKLKKYASIDLSSEENSDVDIMTVSDDDTISIEGSDTRSEVSSVHTSDLSSFDDNISISSEDEDGTKTTTHVPLKLANELFANGGITKLYEICKKKSNSNIPSKKSKRLKSCEDSPNKRLPARNRKPNSKYSSSDVICPIKLPLPSSESTSDKMDVDEVDGNRKRESFRQKIKAKQERQCKVPYDINRVNEIVGSPPSTSKIVFAKKTDIHASVLSNVKPDQQPKGSSNVNKSYQVVTTRPNKETKTTESNYKNTLKVNVNVSLMQPSTNNEVEVKRKRGRPSNKTSSEEDEQITSKSTARNLGEDLMKNSDEMKRKRGRPSNKSLVAMEDVEQTNANKTTSQNDSKNRKNEDQVKHSVESFSRLEEQLCLKDQKTVQSSPPKSSTKSYEKSDLYKPHSDFRVFNSRGSKAFTLFSN